MPVKPIPTGYHSVTPYLTIKGATKALEFYQKAFGAKERMRMPGPDGKIGHAELEIGNSVIMLADEFPEMGNKSAKTLGGSPVGMMLYVEDVDSFVSKAVKAGAKLTKPIKDQFYGDRMGAIEDPFGFTWNVGTHIEDVSPAEMKKRAAAQVNEFEKKKK